MSERNTPSRPQGQAVERLSGVGGRSGNPRPVLAGVASGRSGLKEINTRQQMADLARELKVSPDWHEPDEQEVAARVEGTHLDNAFGASGECGEFVVVISQDGADVAKINLADLLAWASSREEID